jgi:hypothetical protein
MTGSGMQHATSERARTTRLVGWQSNSVPTRTAGTRGQKIHAHPTIEQYKVGLTQEANMQGIADEHEQGTRQAEINLMQPGCSATESVESHHRDRVSRISFHFSGATLVLTALTRRATDRQFRGQYTYFGKGDENGDPPQADQKICLSPYFPILSESSICHR